MLKNIVKWVAKVTKEEYRPMAWYKEFDTKEEAVLFLFHFAEKPAGYDQAVAEVVYKRPWQTVLETMDGYTLNLRAKVFVTLGSETVKVDAH